MLLLKRLFTNLAYCTVFAQSVNWFQLICASSPPVTHYAGGPVVVAQGFDILSAAVVLDYY